MSWWGKLLGGTFGFMIGGPIGALMGAALGHNLDRGLSAMDAESISAQGFNQQNRAQTAFFTATFSVMGHVAKADGRVTPDEIRLVGLLMDHLQLNAEMRSVAQRLFNQGQSADFDVEGVLSQFRRECRHSGNLLRMFVELQLQAAYADGVVHPDERAVLNQVCASLNISHDELAQIETLVRAGIGHGGATVGVDVPSLEDDYAMLGLESDASNDEVKRAYRRMMSRHHPDKLVSKGLPEEMMRVATEKTQQIKAAYERVQHSRGN